ncbi:hypothetical protein J2X45_001691 [Caulobacter sp. BE264]|uniref:hypothetical protein n=1 Tax=Caulobacter sp. BE264 TaxID=2817724 RepID=UPI0028551FD2|nr:hypothetical protein [Caulobacter sp. BE264]MDR7230600.1 hypothetical protein [Caulobacter sp. BE264]
MGGRALPADGPVQIDVGKDLQIVQNAAALGEPAAERRCDISLLGEAELNRRIAFSRGRAGRQDGAG